MTDVTMIPMHSVYLQRDTGKEDPKTKTPIMQRISPKVGVPFKFTHEEIRDIRMMSPLALRSPRNESVDVDAEADQAAGAAAAEALRRGGAPGDAAGTASAGAKGKGKLKPGSTTEVETPEDDIDGI